jgi:hypothetical protein
VLVSSGLRGSIVRLCSSERGGFAGGKFWSLGGEFGGESRWLMGGWRGIEWLVRVNWGCGGKGGLEWEVQELDHGVVRSAKREVLVGGSGTKL